MKHHSFIFLITMIIISFIAVSPAFSAEAEKADLAKKEDVKAAVEEKKSETESAKEKEDIQIVNKQTSGTVSRIDASSINVVYAVREDAEYEIMISLDKNLKLKGYRSIKDIQAEDMVSLIYDEVTRFKGKPEERREMKLKEIHLVKNAVKNAMSSSGGAA